NEKVLIVSDLQITQDDSINFSELNRENLLLKNYGDEKDYELEIRYVSSSGIQNFSNSSVSFSGNSSHQIIPNWNDLQNQPVKILIDLGNNGTIDDTLSLKNEVTGIEDEGSLITPDSYNLTQNYPNPFNPTTTIKYSIPQSGHVSLKVYDVLGNEVAELVNEEKDKGVYSVNFDASGFSSGVYFYRIQAGTFYEIKKMILLK
ncbi:MAG: T9SS C-terminal target domain-containing protein, partial [Ignavibacteriales bacterium]